MVTMRRVLEYLGFLGMLVSPVIAQTTYQQPPRAVLDVLNASPTPVGAMNSTRSYLMLVQGSRYARIADLSQPMLRLAGLRINPMTNGPHMPSEWVGYKLKNIANGSEVEVRVPDGKALSWPVWSPDGQHFAFTHTNMHAVELCIGDLRGQVHCAKQLHLNAMFPSSFHWMPDSRTLLVRLVLEDRGPVPTTLTSPAGPITQESTGHPGAVVASPDHLKNANDEALFEYYGTSQIALFDSVTAKLLRIGEPALYVSSEPSPDGNYILVERLHRPFSYLLDYEDFPTDVLVLDRKARVVYTVASEPLQNLPLDAVRPGPRNCRWHPTQPASLYWIEALDGGNSKSKVAHRDRLMALTAPFTHEREVTRTEFRLNYYEFGKKKGILFADYDPISRERHMFYYHDGAAAPKILWDQNADGAQGVPLVSILPNGHRAVQQFGDEIFLTGVSASATGDRPFLERFSLTSLKSTRIFECDAHSYEVVISLLSEDGSRLLTRHETAEDPPNYLIRDAVSFKALTHFRDPAPQIRRISKQFVTYKRADGVQLSFTLYLPPDYKPGVRLPTILWAYPREYDDAASASRLSASTNHFTTITGYSPLFLVLEGFAVLDNVFMPVVGSPQTVNNNFVEQIVADATAAVNKAVEMGVADPNRIGVGGHSYGAFMTANLLAHSKLFKAGVALSGAYNRTLTPFGFQTERRTFWEARDAYLNMSPFVAADQIKSPLLLIHGEADNNLGAVPMQSERMYQAVRGNGGIARLVLLPHEGHSYSARESIEDVLYEMSSWFSRWVKNATPVVSRIIANRENGVTPCSPSKRCLNKGAVSARAAQKPWGQCCLSPAARDTRLLAFLPQRRHRRFHLSLRKCDSTGIGPVPRCVATGGWESV